MKKKIDNINEFEELYQKAKLIVIQEQKSSIANIQRKLKIDYNLAKSIVEQLEINGVLSKPNNKGYRQVLVKKANFLLQSYSMLSSSFKRHIDFLYLFYLI